MSIIKSLLKNGLYETKDYEGDVLTHTWFESADGKKNGLETEYDKETGLIKRTTEWKDGVKHGHEKLYDNGDVTNDCEFIHGIPYKIYEHPSQERVYEPSYDMVYYDFGWHDGPDEYVGNRYVLSNEIKQLWSKTNSDIYLDSVHIHDLRIRRDFSTTEIDALIFSYNREKLFFIRDKKEGFKKSKITEDEERKNFIRKQSVYNAYYTDDNTAESKATAVIAGIAGLVVATVSVATYMNSSYPNKEKAAEEKKVAPKEIKAGQSRLNQNEMRMFNLALGTSTAEFKAFMEYHKDININASTENGETVLMLMLANDKLKNAEYILEKFGDKIEYKARTNDGTGYQDIMKARLHSPKASGQDIKIDRMIKANTKKEEQQIREGKARSTDSYAFYDLMKGKTKE